LRRASNANCCALGGNFNPAYFNHHHSGNIRLAFLAVVCASVALIAARVAFRLIAGNLAAVMADDKRQAADEANVEYFSIKPTSDPG